MTVKHCASEKNKPTQVNVIGLEFSQRSEDFKSNEDAGFFLSDYKQLNGSKEDPLLIAFSSKPITKKLLEQQELNHEVGMLALD